MPISQEQRWMDNYEALKAYVEEYHHLPDKKKVENRGLLNWWKYNRKCLKQGKLNERRLALLQALSDMREGPHMDNYSIHL